MANFIDINVKINIGDNMINISRLKNIREDNDMSQQNIADILGVNRSTYSLWELGINIIPLDELCKFAKYFNVSIDYVLSTTNDKRKDGTMKELDLKILGNNIKTLRMRQTLSQESVAKILGVTQACIVRYEKGIICMSLSNLYKFSKLFNISMSDLCNKIQK